MANARRSKRQTAKEFLAECAQDPEYVARQQSWHEERARNCSEFMELEKPILEELRTLRVVVPTIGYPECLVAYLPFSKEVIELFLRWLPKSHERIQDCLVRHLCGAAEPFDGTALARLYESIPASVMSTTIRWAIANTIAEARPYGITNWVLKMAVNPNFGPSKEMLMVAVARLAPPEQANPVLLKMFDEYPVHVPMGLAESGGEPELEFLKFHEEKAEAYSKREIKKAIKAIQKRLGKKARAK